MFVDNYYDLELNETSKLGIQSSKINIKLKPHQLAALNKAIDMENNRIVKYKLNNPDDINTVINISTNARPECLRRPWRITRGFLKRKRQIF